MALGVVNVNVKLKRLFDFRVCAFFVKVLFLMPFVVLTGGESKTL